MKKRHIIIIISILVLIIGLVNFNNIRIYIENRIMEKEWEDYYNCKQCPYYISEVSFYNRCNHIYRLEYHKIDEVIEDYLKCLEKAMRKKIYNEKIDSNTFFSNARVPIMNGLRSEAVVLISDLITEQDEEDYRNGIFINRVVKELEKIFEHRSEENYKEWYVKNDEDKILELQYNVYANYIHDDTELVDEVNKILKIKIEHDRKYCTIKYESTDGSIKEKKTPIIDYKYIDKNGKAKTHKFCRPDSLYYKSTQFPEISFGQHDYDREHEKWKAQVDEMTRQKWETKDSDILVHTDMELVSIFKKYKKQALIIVDTFKDDSRKSYFSMLKNEEEKKDSEDYYFVRELPYKDMEINEVMEKYLADEEQVKNDEAKLQGKESKFTYDVNR